MVKILPSTFLISQFVFGKTTWPHPKELLTQFLGRHIHRRKEKKCFDLREALLNCSQCVSNFICLFFFLLYKVVGYGPIDLVMKITKEDHRELEETEIAIGNWIQ